MNKVDFTVVIDAEIYDENEASWPVKSKRKGIELKMEDC